MALNKDWALISNYADKTLLKNFFMYNLSSTLGLYYTPNTKFVELFINSSYCGVYLLTETIKVDKNRIDIPKTGNSFLAEIDFKHKENVQYVTSNQIKTNHSVYIRQKELQIPKSHFFLITSTSLNRT